MTVLPVKISNRRKKWQRTALLTGTVLTLLFAAKDCECVEPGPDSGWRISAEASK